MFSSFFFLVVAFESQLRLLQSIQQHKNKQTMIARLFLFFYGRFYLFLGVSVRYLTPLAPCLALR